MSTNELRQKFIDYYKAKDHLHIPSYPIVPKDDKTTLFVSSGMQPMLPYFLGEPHPSGKTRIVDSQKCFRAVDIDEVGDNQHTTFFEMLGNWSFGDYWKEDQLRWIFSFLLDELKMDINKLFITVFDGDEENKVPRDEESAQIWQTLFKERGVEAKIGERIFYHGADKNWWSREGSPAEMTIGEPGGPDSEIFYRFDDGSELEICNSVFMQYKKVGEGKFEPLPKKNVDFGAGLERLAAALNNDSDVFKIDLFWPLIEEISKSTEKPYEGENMAPMQVIADHMRAATMMILEGVLPANKLAGYILRRLIRRSAVKYYELMGSADFDSSPLCNKVLETYNITDESSKNLANSAMTEEIQKFTLTLEKGLKEFQRLSPFDLYQSYGFPVEITKEIMDKKGIKFDLAEFEAQKKKHLEASK